MVQNYNTMTICYTVLPLHFLHFTKHGECVGDETKMGLLTKQGAVLFNWFPLPSLTLSQLSAHLRLWKCFQSAFPH